MWNSELKRGSSELRKSLRTIPHLLFLLVFFICAPCVTASADVCKQLPKADERLDTNCKNECSLKKKKHWLNALVAIQARMDAFGCDEVRNYEELCGGLYNLEDTWIDVTPVSSNLSIDEKVTLSAQIIGEVGEECEDGLTGEIHWVSFDSSVASVTQDGLVTGHESGETTILAISSDLPEVLGAADVTVASECDTDNDGRLDSDKAVAAGACCCGPPHPDWLWQTCGITSCPEDAVYVCRICGDPATMEVWEIRDGICPPGGGSCFYWGNLEPKATRRPWLGKSSEAQARKEVRFRRRRRSADWMP